MVGVIQRVLGGGEHLSRAGVQAGRQKTALLRQHTLKPRDHLARDGGDGAFVNLEKRPVAVDDVIGAVVAGVLGEVDHAVAAVHVAAAVLVAHPEPLPLLLQNAQGRSGGHPAQGPALSGALEEVQVDDGPDGAVQRGDGGVEGDLLLHLLLAAAVSGEHLVAVAGPGVQAAQLVAEALRGLRPVQGHPGAVPPLPELVFTPPGLGPLQGVYPGL